MRPISEIISLKGKKALITGAASGIGLATSIRFAEVGADLELVDINDEGLKKAKERLSAFNVKVNVHKVDLSIKKEIDTLWEKLDQNPPDILINNAGIFPFKDFLELDEQFLDKVLEVNLKSVFWMCQHMIKRRLKQGGVIVNVASIEALIPFEDQLAHYTSTKAGVIALTRALAKEYGKHGFKINAILPGGIMTPGVKKAAMKLGIKAIKEGREFKKRVPLGRLGDPDEVARMILVLASDLSSYMQGALIVVDGGLSSA